MSNGLTTSFTPLYVTEIVWLLSKIKTVLGRGGVLVDSVILYHGYHRLPQAEGSTIVLEFI